MAEKKKPMPYIIRNFPFEKFLSFIPSVWKFVVFQASLLSREMVDNLIIKKKERSEFSFSC